MDGLSLSSITSGIVSIRLSFPGRKQRGCGLTLPLGSLETPFQSVLGIHLMAVLAGPLPGKMATYAETPEASASPLVPKTHGDQHLGLTLKDVAVIVRLLGRAPLVLGPPLRSLRKRLVADGPLGGVFQAVDVVVSDTIAELLLLTPEDRVGQVLFTVR